MGQQTRTRPFVADPNEWEVVEGDGDEYEVVTDEAAPNEPTWAESMGLHTPTANPLVGFLRGAGTGAVDLVQGAVANVTGQMNEKVRGENQTAAELAQALGHQPRAPKTTVPDVQQPQNLSGGVGAALPMVAEIGIGGGPVAAKALDAVPRAARAGAKFQDVMGAARNIPIDTKAVGDAALRISELAERGGAMPMAVRKILNRMTDPNKAPMAYEEARDFASNISRLSANEFGRLTPAVAREVANLRVALNEANALAAKAAGKLPEYKAAMREYAQAMKIKDAVESAVKGAKRSLPYATAAGAGYWLTRELKSLLGGGGE